MDTKMLRYVHYSIEIVDFEVEIPEYAIPLQIILSRKNLLSREKAVLVYLIPKEKEGEEDARMKELGYHLKRKSARTPKKEDC